MYGTVAVRQLRDSILERRGLLGPASDARRPPLLPTRPEGTDSLSAQLEVASQCFPGDDVLAKVIQAAALSEQGVDEPGLKEIFQEILGDEPRLLMGKMAHSALLGTQADTLRRHINDVAAAAHFGSRAWISMYCVSLLAEVELGHIEPIACVEYMLYDETAFGMRSGSAAPGVAGAAIRQDASDHQPRFTAAGGGSGAVGGAAHRPRRSKGMSKVVQAEHFLAWVFRLKANAQPVIWVMPVNPPIQIIDRGTGECLRAALLRMQDIPCLRDLASKFVFWTSAFTADRASSNVRCESSISLERGRPNLRLPCIAHAGSTAQGHSYACVSGIISGVVNLSLSQQGAKSTEKLRYCISLVLFHSCRVVDGIGAIECDQFRRRLDALLDLCLPRSESGHRRRLILSTGMVGDSSGDRIYWVRPGGDAAVTREMLWDWAPLAFVCHERLLLEGRS